MYSKGLTADEIIRRFNLKPLPAEGGMWVQTYRSSDVILAEALPQRYPRFAKSMCNAILYLLTSGSFSALHRNATDEIYHFCLGDPIEMLLLYPDGSSQRTILGQDILHDQQVQFTVPHGVWQGSHLLPGGRFGFCGSSMAPAFSETDWEGGDREELLAKYPKEAELITQLTHQHTVKRMDKLEWPNMKRLNVQSGN
jgi:hypothetical protein